MLKLFFSGAHFLYMSDNGQYISAGMVGDDSVEILETQNFRLVFKIKISDKIYFYQLNSDFSELIVYTKK